MFILNMKLKYYSFNYLRFLKWGVTSEYYKKRMNDTKKEIKKKEKRYTEF